MNRIFSTAITRSSGWKNGWKAGRGKVNLVRHASILKIAGVLAATLSTEGALASPPEGDSVAPSFQEISILFEPQARCLVWGSNGRFFPAPGPEASANEVMDFLRETGQEVKSACDEVGKEASRTFLTKPEFAQKAQFLNDFGHFYSKVIAEIELEPAVDGQGAVGVIWFNQAVRFLSLHYLPCLEKGLSEADPNELESRKIAWQTAANIDATCLELRTEASSDKPFPDVDFVSGDLDFSHTKNQARHRGRLRDWFEMVITYHAGLKGKRPFTAVRFKATPKLESNG